MKGSISGSTAAKAAIGTGAAATAVVVPVVTLTGGSGENETTLSDQEPVEPEIPTDNVQEDLEKLGYKWKPLAALAKAKVGHSKTSEIELIEDFLFANQSDNALFRRGLSPFDKTAPFNTDSLFADKYDKKNYIKASDAIEALLFFEMGYPTSASGSNVQGVARWELAINAGNQNVLITGFLNIGTKSFASWRISTFVDRLPYADENQPYTLNENKAIVVDLCSYKSGSQTFKVKNPKTGSADWSVTSQTICSSCSAADNTSWTWTNYAAVWKPNSESSEKLLDVISSTESNKFSFLNNSYSVDTENKNTKYVYTQDRWRQQSTSIQNSDLKSFTDKTVAGLKDRKGSWVSTTDYCNELKETTKTMPREPKNPKKEKRPQILRICTEPKAT